MGYVQADRNLDLFFEIDYSSFNIPIPAPPPPPPPPVKPKDFDSIPMEVREKTEIKLKEKKARNAHKNYYVNLTGVWRRT